jgi:hypothetical protein
VIFDPVLCATRVPPGGMLSRSIGATEFDIWFSVQGTASGVTADANFARYIVLFGVAFLSSRFV